MSEIVKLPLEIFDFPLESPTQPLNSIELEGFKSFRHLPSFRLNPGLNVLIGANGAGKSNFLRFFELLQSMIAPNKGLQNYLRRNGSADAFLYRGAKTTEKLSTRLQIGALEYSFSLKPATDGSMFLAAEEILIHYKDANLVPVGWVAISRHEGQKESHLKRKTAKTSSEEWVAALISGWTLYHFNDTSDEAKLTKPCNTVDSIRLHHDASNISAFLGKIQSQHLEHYIRIVETIRLAAPFFGDFVLDEVGPGQTQLLWREQYADPIYYPHQLSDGTLRFICLVALLLQPAPPSTILIDEPELGLHPYAIELLAGLLREASTRCQLIVSTQSTQLVNELDPEDLIVVDRKAGETTFSRHNSAELATWLEEYSLGDLWNKNVLGGRPQA